MNRKQFLKRSGALALGIGLVQAGCRPSISTDASTNWAGNLTYRAADVLFPSTTDELRQALKKIRNGKTLGSQHSFSTVADTTGTHISTKKMNRLLSLDQENLIAWMEPGVRYGDLALWLDKQGYAVHNLASLPHISVAGACATATHGSGDYNGNLSTAVRGMEIMKADGTTVMLDPSMPEFNGAVVHLGALGVVTKIGLAIQPRFEMRQEVFENLPMAALENHFHIIFSMGYSVSMFTHWRDKTINQVWVKHRIGDGYAGTYGDLYGATPATENLHPIKTNSAVNCTEQMNKFGPWYERLPHFKMGFTPSNGAELQTEFFVPREHAFKAIMAVEALHEEITPALFVTEIRTIAADELWMSPAYGKHIIAIHFTWKPEPEKVMPLIPKIEAALKPYEPIPHWGKIFTLPHGELTSRYPKHGDFLKLVQAFDPDGVWRNDYLNRNIFGDQA
ncbi:MAG: FAD-binding protein [Bacteroidota bacterium]